METATEEVKPINVLMVEDDEVDIMNVQRLFRRNNLTSPLYIARNGLEALDLLHSKVIHNVAVQQDFNATHSTELPAQVLSNRWVILLDMNLPVMNGVEFFQALCQIPDLAIIPIVPLISSPKDQERSIYRQIPAIAYMMKPITLDRLLEILAEVRQYWTNLNFFSEPI